jgi:hypothetical protein
MANSSPRPKALPWIAAITGFADASMFLTMVRELGSARGGRVERLHVGATAEQLAGADDHDRLYSRIGPGRVRLAASSWRSAWPMAFTGGLLSVRTATLPWRE